MFTSSSWCCPSSRYQIQFRHLKQKPYWGNHFWSRGYCVDIIGLDAEKTRLYVKYQEKRERQAEQGRFQFG